MLVRRGESDQRRTRRVEEKRRQIKAWLVNVVGRLECSQPSDDDKNGFV
jgi:hypothetical protein